MPAASAAMVTGAWRFGQAATSTASRDGSATRSGQASYARGSPLPRPPQRTTPGCDWPPRRRARPRSGGTGADAPPGDPAGADDPQPQLGHAGRSVMSAPGSRGPRRTRRGLTTATVELRLPDVVVEGCARDGHTVDADGRGRCADERRPDGLLAVEPHPRRRPRTARRRRPTTPPIVIAGASMRRRTTHPGTDATRRTRAPEHPPGKRAHSPWLAAAVAGPRPRSSASVAATARLGRREPRTARRCRRPATPTSGSSTS